MKKSQLKIERREQKKRRPLRTILACVALAMLAVCLSVVTRKDQPEQRQSTQLPTPPDIEAYIRSMITTQEVLPGMHPAAIYYKKPSMLEEKFCCVGTVFTDAENGLQILTSEHILRIDNTEQSLGVKLLRGSLNFSEVWMDKIIKKGKDFGSDDKKDAMLATLADSPVVFTPYSTFVHGEIAQNFWGEVVHHDKKIATLRSLLSGEAFTTIGYAKRSEGTNDTVFILIDRISYAGESGSGFVDEYGGLWVLHASPADAELQSQIVKECLELSGRKIQATTAMSGPFGGRYD